MSFWCRWTRTIQEEGGHGLWRDCRGLSFCRDYDQVCDHGPATEAEARKSRGKLKAAETESAVAGRGIKTQERQKRTLERQIDKYRKDLAELKK